VCGRNATALWRVAARRSAEDAAGRSRRHPGAVGVWPPFAAWKMGADCKAAGVAGKVARDGRSTAVLGERRRRSRRATTRVDGISDTNPGWTVFEIPSTLGSYESFNRACTV